MPPALLALALVARALPAGVQDQLTPRQVAAAFELSRSDDVPTIKVGDVAGDFTVRLLGPVSRLAREIADRRLAGQDVTTENLPAASRRALLLVDVQPSQPTAETISNWQLLTRPDKTAPYLTASPVAWEVWLEPAGGGERLEPIERHATNWTWRNMEGGPDVKGRGLEVTFDALALPPGDLTVVILTSDGESRWTVSARQRGRLR